MSRLAALNTHIPPVPVAAESTRLSSAARAATSAAAPTQAADVTRLSGSAGSLARAVSGSDVRLDKVAALQQQIQSGTYNVSAADVADKLISSLLGGR